MALNGNTHMDKFHDLIHKTPIWDDVNESHTFPKERRIPYELVIDISLNFRIN